jgi:heat shock protein HslJ
MNDDSRTEPDDPTRYTLEFLPEGRVALRVDCNRGTASYALDGAQLTLGPAALTMMACPPGSFTDPFLQQLGEVTSYLMDGENLVLELRLDSGGMVFAPASSAGKE